MLIKTDLIAWIKIAFPGNPNFKGGEPYTKVEEISRSKLK
jgi:hypothetical protein